MGWGGGGGDCTQHLRAQAALIRTSSALRPPAKGLYSALEAFKTTAKFLDSAVEGPSRPLERLQKAFNTQQALH